MRFLILPGGSTDRELFTQILQKNFYDSYFINVIHQKDLNEATTQSNFDVAIMGYHSGWTDGPSILTTLKKQFPFLPVIIVANTTDEKIAIAEMKLGLTDFILREHINRLPEAIHESMKKAQLSKVYGEAQWENEAYYQLLFENNPYPMWISNQETLSFLAVNNAAIHHYGYSREEFLRMTMQDICTTEHIFTLLDHLARERISSELCSNGTGTERHRRKDGASIDVEITRNQIFFRGEKAVLVLVHDITKCKRVEEELRKYEILFSKIRDLAYICDPKGTILFLNKIFEKFTNRKPEEFIGKSFEPLFDEENLNKAKAIRARTLNGENLQFELTFKDTGIVCEYKNFPLMDEKGVVIGTIGIARDITGRKEIEQRMSIQYAVTRILVESVTLHEATLKIIQTVCESQKWDLGIRWTVEKKTNMLRCTDIWHKPSITVEEFVAINRRTVFSSSIGLPGRVYISGKPCWIADIVFDADFPRSHIAAKENLHAAFGFPILCGKKVLGVMEFFSQKIWQPDKNLIIMMASIGEQIGQFTEKKQAEESLRRRIDFEKTVASISTRFVILSDLNNAIDIALADAGQLSGANRAYLFQLRDNGNIVDNTHEWCDNGVQPEIQNLQNIPVSMFPWWKENMYAGNTIHITDVSQMPPEAAAEKEILEKQGVKSLLALPVYTEKKLAGFIGFDNTVATGTWNEDDLNLLRITAEIIGNAIARKQSEAIINHMAYHDALTSLPNRILFQNRLEVAILHAKQNARAVAIMILDLDNFKIINDSLGHHTGDLLLKAVAERLMQCVRKSDTIARMGGDEFMIILHEIMQIQDAALIAQKILRTLYQPFQFNGHEIYTSASIGISLYPQDANDTEGLIKHADIAMYLSKEYGKNKYRFYKSDLNTDM